MNTPLLIGDALRRNAYKYPLKVALRDSAREVTYRELNERVNRLANSLLDRGIRKGDAVALLVGNRIEHLEIVFALAKIGALAIPLDVKWRSLEIGSTLSSLEPAALFVEQSCLQEWALARKQKRLDSIKVIPVGDESYNAMVESENAEEPQAEVGEEHVEILLGGQLDGLAAAAGRRHLGPLGRQQQREDVADVPRVLDEEHSRPAQVLPALHRPD